MINKFKKIVLKLAIVACIIIVASMGLKIAMTKDYRGGRSYVSYSPDGNYKIDEVLIKNYDNALFVLTDIKAKRVITIKTVPLDHLGSSFDLWLCNGKDILCTEYCYGGEFDTISLPPSWWNQLHAWLTIKLKGLEKTNLKVVKINERYPPIAKESQ